MERASGFVIVYTIEAASTLENGVVGAPLSLRGRAELGQSEHFGRFGAIRPKLELNDMKEQWILVLV